MRRKVVSVSAIGLLMAASGMAGGAVPGVQDRDKPLAGLATCHAMADNGQKAACYDREYAAMQAAVEKGDLVMVDREGVRQARQSLFGFSLPSLAIFGGGNGEKAKGKAPDADELQEISATVRSASMDGEGRWVVVLDNGSTWRQTSEETLGRNPRAGDPVVIHRGALGSFVMRIGKMPGVKARREG